MQISNNFWRAFRLPTLGTWNMKLERQVGANWLFGAAYAGNDIIFPATKTALGKRTTVGNTQARRRVQGFGDSGKGILRGPRFFDTDLGLIKDTSVTERTKVQFRAEFFNVCNNGRPGFGKITSAGDPRIF